MTVAPEAAATATGAVAGWSEFRAEGGVVADVESWEIEAADASDLDVPDEVRDRLCLALDTDDLVEAARWARMLDPWIGIVKVGPELYVSAGPAAVTSMLEMGLRVFVDLKLHDIPSTVERSARVLGSLGVHYLSLHAHGGDDMLRAGVTGARAGAEAAGLAVPRALAVALLTSDDSAPDHIHPRRISLAMEAGCDGVLCPVGDVASTKAAHPGTVVAATGIRLDGQGADDHRRVASPQQALAAGADLLVVGRSVIASDDPEAVAESLVDAVLS